jgi:hypothetical protein
LEKEGLQQLQHESVNKKAPKAQGAKGKGKRCREDDIPPEPTPLAADNNRSLEQLKQHLLCQAHSRGGQVTYCTINRSGEGGRGGHEPLTHKDMTLWAKKIVSGEIK